MLWSSMFYYKEVSCESWETQTMTVISKAFIWQFIIWWMWCIPFQFCNFSWVFWKNAFSIGTSLSSLFKYVLVNGWSMSSFPFEIFSIHIWINGHLSDIIFFFLSSPRWIKCFKQNCNIYGKDFCLFFSSPHCYLRWGRCHSLPGRNGSRMKCRVYKTNEKIRETLR